MTNLDCGCVATFKLALAERTELPTLRKVGRQLRQNNIVAVTEIKLPWYLSSQRRDKGTLIMIILYGIMRGVKSYSELGVSTSGFEYGFIRTSEYSPPGRGRS